MKSSIQKCGYCIIKSNYQISNALKTHSAAVGERKHWTCQRKL